MDQPMVYRHKYWYVDLNTQLHLSLIHISPQKDIAFDELFEKLVSLLNDASRVKSLMKEKDYPSFLAAFTDNEHQTI